MHRSFRLTASAVVAAGALILLAVAPASAGAGIVGSGSSFAGIELQQWTRDVTSTKYNLNVNYTSSSSGAGRAQFRDKTVDYAVSDIRYNKFDGNGPAFGCSPPDAVTGCGFIYVPVTAGGVAVMYNLKAHGFTETSKPIQLSDASFCAVFTGAVPYWDDAKIKADNPGVNLPHVALTPVVRNDPAGTNFVMEEYCQAKQPAAYAAFAQAVGQQTGQSFPQHEATSTWPIAAPIQGANGSDGCADRVAAVNSDGFVTAVETAYASQRHFPVASVKNGGGNYVQPTEDNVSAALSYATQQNDGTHTLNFDPPANAYNPSTYSYLLARIDSGFDAGKGATLTAFANYALTIGQTEANKLKYASIGRNLILFGLNELKQIPGYVAPTAEEQAAIPTTDKFNNKVVGNVPGVTSGSGPGGTAGGARGAAGGAGSTGGAGSADGAGGAGSAGVAGVDPSASLDPSVAGMARTGGVHTTVAMLGAACLLGGEVVRRRVRARMRGA